MVIPTGLTGIESPCLCASGSGWSGTILPCVMDTKMNRHTALHPHTKGTSTRIKPPKIQQAKKKQKAKGKKISR